LPLTCLYFISPTTAGRLLIMKWIGKDITVKNRWYPVFKRYLGQLVGRVTFMNGDPDKVIPTGTGN
jgi:hypothetical protein